MPCMRARPSCKSPEKARLRRWLGDFLMCHLFLMQSSTRVVRPVATRTLVMLVYEAAETLG